MNNGNCHICDHPAPEAQNGSVSYCLICGTDLATPQTETKLMEASLRATYATKDKISALRKQASAYLTDKRLIVIPAKLSGFGLTGALTAAVYNKMVNKSGVISIPFEHIKAVRDGRFGLFVKAVIVETTGGEMVKITVPKQNQWKEVIQKSSKC